MKTLSGEIDANYTAFSAAWYAEMNRVYADLQPQGARFRDSYKRLVSLQAWRSELLESTLAEDSLGFFLEAQNDGLVSLVLASLGSTRAALQSLRSCLENVLYTAYYMDHPVELRLWQAGKHRLAFNALHNYLSAHPSIVDVDKSVHSLEVLAHEYSTLSLAVHGTAASFRMSAAETGTQLWSSESARVGKYDTRQKNTLAALNQLLLCLFNGHLQGAARQNLRKAISFAVPTSKHRSIKTSLGVTLFSP